MKKIPGTLGLAIWMAASCYSQTPPEGPAGGIRSGYGIYQTNCSGCHGNPGVQKAPDPNTLRQMSPEKIYDALTTGAMKVVGDKLTDQQKRTVAEAVSGRNLGSLASGDATRMPNRCSTNPAMSDPAKSAGWNGWGVDVGNTRFQTAKGAGLSPENVGRLKLKWAFGFPASVAAFGQPTVVSGRIFVGSDNGYV